MDDEMVEKLTSPVKWEFKYEEPGPPSDQAKASLKAKVMAAFGLKPR